MPKKIHKRKDVIDHLVGDDMDNLKNSFEAVEGEIEDILRNGFKGYSHFTNKELSTEIRSRFEDEITVR